MKVRVKFCFFMFLVGISLLFTAGCGGGYSENSSSDISLSNPAAAVDSGETNLSDKVNELLYKGLNPQL